MSNNYYYGYGCLKYENFKNKSKNGQHQHTLESNLEKQNSSQNQGAID